MSIPDRLNRCALAALLLALVAPAEAQTAGWVTVATTATRTFSVDTSRLERTAAGVGGWMAQAPTPEHEADFDAAERRRLDARAATWTRPEAIVAQSQTAFEADCGASRLALRASVALDAEGQTVARAESDSAAWRPVTDGSLSGALVAAVCAWRASPRDSADVMPEIIGGMRGLMEQVVYPDAERRARRQGRVVVRVVVGTDGLPTDLAVVESAGPGLDAAAIEAVRAARFTPGLVGGEPVPVVMSIPIIFRLR